jgi:hypothetical protein
MLDQRAERVACEPRIQFVGGDGGINGHENACRT